MPSKMKDGRWRATKQVQGRRVWGPIFPPGRQGRADAYEWERRKGIELQKTATVCSALDWATQYMDYVQINRAGNTYGQVKTAFQGFLATIDPDCGVDEIGPSSAMAYLQSVAKDVSGHKANKHRTLLATAWKHGTQYLDRFPRLENPFLSVPKFQSPKKDKYIPPIDDFWAVHSLANDQDKVMLECYLFLAARKTEIFRLKWTDIDFPGNQVLLRTTKTGGKGERADWLPMVPQLRKSLLYWWEHRPIKNEWVFVNTSNNSYCLGYKGKPFQTRTDWLYRLCKAAKVERFNYHAIRHLTASVLHQKGVSAREIQKILRHGSISTTEKYLHDLSSAAELTGALGHLERGEVIRLDRRNKRNS